MLILRNFQNNLAFNCSIKKKIPRNKFDQGGKKCLQFIIRSVRHQWKKLKKTQISGKIFSADGLGELILLKSPYWKRSIPLKPIYGFNPYCISHYIFYREQTILKFVWNHKRQQIAKEILRKKSKMKVSYFLIPNYITKP